MSPDENAYRLRWNTAARAVDGLVQSDISTDFQELVKDPVARASWV